MKYVITYGTLLALAAGACDSGPTTPIPRRPASVTLQPGNTALRALGDTLRVRAIVRDGAGSVLPAARVAWTASDATIALLADSVGPTVLVTARHNGVSTVSATAGDVSCSLFLTVAQEAARVIITPTLPDTFFSLDTFRLTAVVADARGNRMPAAAVRWSAPNASIFEFALYGPQGLTGWSTEVADTSVLLDLMMNGSGLLQATVPGASQTATVTVRQRAVALHFFFGVAGYGLATDSVALRVNESSDVVVDPTDARGHPIDIGQFDHGLVVSASDSAVANLSMGSDCNEADYCWQARWAVGVSPGVATLTASAATIDGVFAATAKVTVTAGTISAIDGLEGRATSRRGRGS